jgi:hypothetical protein
MRAPIDTRRCAESVPTSAVRAKGYGNDAHLITISYLLLRQAQTAAVEPVDAAGSTEERVRIKHWKRERKPPPVSDCYGHSCIQAAPGSPLHDGSDE